MLRTTAVVALLATLMASCGDHAATGVAYAPVVTPYGVGIRDLRALPRTMVVAGDGSEYITAVHLQELHRGYAFGTATLFVDDCDPGCAGGTFHPVKASVRFTQSLACRGKRVMTRLKIDAPEAPRFVHLAHQTIYLNFLAGLCVFQAAAPTLGVVWAPSQRGYGEVQPTEVSNGGDPTGTLDHVRWRNWGQKRALGTGRGWRPPDKGFYNNFERATARIVAWKLGTCHGRRAYTALTWYYPAYGEKFNPRAYIDICLGKFVRDR